MKRNLMMSLIAVVIVIIVLVAGLIVLGNNSNDGGNENISGVGGGTWMPKAGDYIVYWMVDSYGEPRTEWSVNLTITSITSTELTINSVKTEKNNSIPTQQTQITVPISRVFGTGIASLGDSHFMFEDPNYLSLGYSIANRYGGSGNVNTMIGQIPCDFHSLDYSGDVGSWGMDMYVHNGILIKGDCWTDVMIQDTNLGTDVISTTSW